MNKKRESFTLRLQPYQGCPLASVINYLESRETRDTKKIITEILLMCLLPLARFEEGSHSKEELRRICLDAGDAMEKHSWYVRQVLGVESLRPHLVADTVEAVSTGDSTKRKRFEPLDKSSPAVPVIEDQTSNDEIDSLFGSTFG